MDEDLALALQLQAEYDAEQQADEVQQILPPDGTKGFGDRKDLSPADPQWEILDPSPDVRSLFAEFNQRYFWGKLDMVEVRWSPRMTLCAGLCVYEGRGGLCSVRLSEPLLKLRPRKDLVETLLHEMIHALLFVTQNNKDHDGHGPEFQKHMHRINDDAGTKISIYHSFHDEVDNYRTHWWKCDGPCQKRPPYFGLVKRAMNRPPSARDPWWPDHQRTCGGTYTKIKEPEGYGQKKSKSKDAKNDKPPKDGPDIRNFMNSGMKTGGASGSQGGDQDKNKGKKKGGGIQVFAGSGDDVANSNGNTNNKVQPNWRPAPVSPAKYVDGDDAEKGASNSRIINPFSGEGKTLGSSSQASAGSAGNSGGENRVIVRRIPGFGVITSERYTSPTKQHNIKDNKPHTGIMPPINGAVRTPSHTVTSNDFISEGSRKRKSLPVDLDISDGEDYLPKAKQHRRSDSMEFTVDTPPGSLVSVPGFRSVCSGHSSDRRHMNSVAIDHAKKVNSKSATGKGVKGVGKTRTNNDNKGAEKKRPKRLTNINNYAADRNARVLLDSSDSDSDDEEFAPLSSASRKKNDTSEQNEEETDPDWKFNWKKIKLDSDSDNDSVILEDRKKSPAEEDPFDLPYKMKFPDSPVKVQHDTASSVAYSGETPGVSGASLPSTAGSAELVDCPACTAKLPLSEINAHLDMCLA